MRKVLSSILGVSVFSCAVALVTPAQAAVSIADFENGTTSGFGALTNSGVQPWASPVAGAVVTPATSGLAGSKVLELTGTPAFNFGQSGGAALGLDLLSANLRSAFLANNAIEFDWVAVPNGSPSGFSQLFNVILNSQGGGFTNVDGYSFNGTGAPPADKSNFNQFYFTGYSGPTHHIVVNYTNYKNTVLASGNPDGGNFLQLGIQPNAGGGAPGDMYFDNFQFTLVPEPASIAFATVALLPLLRRRRT
jgi:hypothetical protein